MTTIGIIDYGMGNRRSVYKAIEHVGAQALLTSDPGVLSGCDGLVLPGVGAFPAAMRNLEQRGLIGFIGERAAAGTPLLGICLGMQLLFDESSEGEPTRGLGLVPGTVAQLDSGTRRLPHIGWNEVRWERDSPLTGQLPPTGCPFYHVHSFVAHPADADHVVGTAEYGERFASIVGAGNVLGAQFHPEKSSTHGLLMLGSFVRLCARSSPVAA